MSRAKVGAHHGQKAPTTGRNEVAPEQSSFAVGLRVLMVNGRNSETSQESAWEEPSTGARQPEERMKKEQGVESSETWADAND